MEDKDYIKELFSDKLKNQEAPVNPELWSSVSASVQGTSAVGTSLLTKVVIGISATTAIAVASFFVFQNKVEKENEKQLTVIKEAKPKLVLSKEKTNIDPKENLTKEVQLAAPKYLPKDKPKQHKEIIPKEEGKVEQEKEVLIDLKGGFPDPGPIIFEQQPKGVEKETKDEITNTIEKDNSIVGDEKTAIDHELKTYYLEDLPNVFTPNGDMSNDYLQIESRGLEKFSVTILNEKGEKVFFTQDPSFKWDGTDMKDLPVPNGTYIYYLIAESAAGEAISKYSYLTIKR